MRDLKIPIAVGVFLVVLIVGVLGRTVYHQRRVIDPAVELVARVPGVETVRLDEREDGRMDVHIEVAPDARLDETHRRAFAAAAGRLGAAFGRLVLDDNRSDVLREAYYRIHFYVQEGISTGHFARMAAAVDHALAAAEVDHRVYVTDDFVYVAMYDGDHRLYEVLPRSPGGQVTAAAGRGSSQW